MANPFPSQDDAATNYHVDSAATGTPTTGPGSHKVTVQAPVTATAFQVDAVRDADLYISVNTAAALAVAIGSTNAASTAIMPSQSAALGVICLHVPGGWYVKLTGTMANLTVTSVLK